MNEVLTYKAAKADEIIKIIEIKEELNRKLVEVRKVTLSMMATLIPPLMATKNSPTLEVKYLGMKEEKIFNIRALNNPHRA